MTVLEGPKLVIFIPTQIQSNTQDSLSYDFYLYSKMSPEIRVKKSCILIYLIKMCNQMTPMVIFALAYDS